MLKLRSAQWSLLASTLLVGCYSSSYGNSGDGDSGTDGDSDSDADLDTDYDSDFDGDTEQCTLLYDSYSGNTITSYVYQEGPGDYWVETFDSEWNGESWDAVALLELYGAEPGDVVDLTFHAQYKTCDYCALAFLDCPVDNLADCDKAFVASSGLVHVIAYKPEQPWDGDLEFVVSDAVFEESMINWTTYESTAVPDGDKICVGMWHVVTVPQFP